MKLDLREELGLGDAPLTTDQRQDLIRSLAEEMLRILDAGAYKSNALTRLIDAEAESDALRAANKMAGANVMVTLALVDAIQEATATLKEVANRQVESAIELTAKLREVA